jgi:periplasmic protein TonB
MTGPANPEETRMLNSTALRTPTAALMALPVAYGLFLLMNSLIQVKEITIVPAASRVLDAITPQRPDPDAPMTKHPKPTPLESAMQPPPPPRASATVTDIVLPTPLVPGAVPTGLPTHVKMPTIGPVMISSRDYQVVRPPLPVYPRRAAERGISGTCNGAFSIDPRGKPFRVSATCSDPVFVSEAESSVSKAEFAPQLVDGQFVTVTGLEYPLNFKLGD